MKTGQWVPSRIANPSVVSIEGIVSPFVPRGDLHLRAWFGLVANLAVDVLLGTSFINRCIKGIFPSERKIVAFSDN